MIAALSPRERLLLALGLAVVVLGLGWTLIWQPLSVSRDALRARIADTRTLAAAIAAYPEGAAPVATTPAPTGPLAPRVTAAAEVAGVPLTRIEPRGTGLTVVVDDAPFDAVIGWIAAMEADGGLRLDAVTLDRRPTPGTVSARLDLEPAS